MELSNEQVMLIFFILFLIASIWKIWAFLPNKVLADDDTTEASQEELIELIIIVIQENHSEITSCEILELVKEHDAFDKEHFWRFNQNKLNQLLKQYYLQNSDVSTIKDIYCLNKI